MTPTQLTMGEEEMCNTSLGLGIGNEIVGRKESDRRKNKRVVCLDLSFPLCLKGEEDIDDRVDDGCKDEGSISSKTLDEDERAREQSNSCITKNNNNNNYGSRKKLRLTKEQSTLLEDSFKLHTTLNTGQKQALAEKLNLLPRQVEVWFQNRRARTKLKQTEVDCEFLKKCCESLSDENRRLKKELQDLCPFKVEQLPQPHSPSSIPLPNTTTMSICSSCEKTVKGVVKSGGGGRGEGLKIGSAVNNEAVHDSKVCKINNSEQL